MAIYKNGWGFRDLDKPSDCHVGFDFFLNSFTIHIFEELFSVTLLARSFLEIGLEFLITFISIKIFPFRLVLKKKRSKRLPIALQGGSISSVSGGCAVFVVTQNETAEDEADLTFIFFDYIREEWKGGGAARTLIVCIFDNHHFCILGDFKIVTDIAVTLIFFDIF